MRGAFGNTRSILAHRSPVDQSRAPLPHSSTGVSTSRLHTAPRLVPLSLLPLLASSTLVRIQAMSLRGPTLQPSLLNRYNLVARFHQRLQRVHEPNRCYTGFHNWPFEDHVHTVCLIEKLVLSHRRGKLKTIIRLQSTPYDLSLSRQALSSRKMPRPGPARLTPPSVVAHRPSTLS